MATQDDNNLQLLAPPAVAALRRQDGSNRVPIHRTDSMDIRDEREDLKQAAEQSLNVILDLGLDGVIRWVSPSWKDVVGTSADEIKGKPIADLLLSNKNAFADAVESMKMDDSRSQIVRFRVRVGELSPLGGTKPCVGPSQSPDAAPGSVENQGEQEEETISLEGQGIMVYDRSSAGESHTMWMIRPAPKPREVTIDLPDLLVESLGVGAEMLAHYLTALAEAGANDPENHPPPLPVLCRICERQITPWWFEKHSEVCLQEYRAEMDVQLAQEALSDHRNTIVKVLDALEAQKRPTSGDVTVVQPPEYKGFPIGPSSNSSPGSDSGRASPTPSRSRDSSITGSSHMRSRSFAVRRPLSRIVELILDLCDTALEISTPAIKDTKAQEGGDFRAQSPQSESRISQVMGWQSLSSGTMEQEQGLALLSADTENLARAKAEAILRHRGIIEYSERLRVESSALVAECIDAALRKAAQIVAGQLSDSLSSSDGEEEAETPAAQESQSGQDDAYFFRSYDGQPAMVSALRTSSVSSSVADPERRRSSLVPSSRSSSPLECPTPRSNMTNIAFLNRSQSVSKRSSLYLGSDTGESDSNLSSSIVADARQTESPSSLTRSSSSNEHKRRSLRLPHVPSPHRQSSPARNVQPASPLNISKPRLPVNHTGNHDGLPSPTTSPCLSTTEHSSPVIRTHRHRRQSSAASSSVDLSKPPPSPRLASLSHLQARAVPTSIKDFEIIKPISKGAFGSVYLSKKKSTGDYFAIKVLKKADMVAKNQVTNVKAERAIMMWQGESDFVAKLYWTFSSKDYLYLVMEYLNGGDCASLVKVLGGLPEDWAKKYLAEVVLGVEHLHSRGIVHRDLKPDNLLIDQKGHLKLTDFGLSRMGLIGRQKRHLKSPKESNPPDILKSGLFARATSMASSRSASFDFQGNHSPSSTPIMTPDLAGSNGQPSYFSLNKDSGLARQHSRRKSGYRSDSGNSDTFNVMFRNFSLNDDPNPRGAPIEEETHSEGDSPDPYVLQPSISNAGGISMHTPPQSGMLPPPMALFDPEDQNRRFVGTPDYLAPETINGLGQDEMSDWWSLGCILFEFLFGYPPFHADTPEKVFENILARRIDWPGEEEMSMVSADAKDLMERLMTVNPKERLGANMEERFSSGGEEIRKHVWFASINWQTLLEDEAQFVPAPENPEDTEYFDARGATLQAFAEEMEDQASSPAPTPGADYPERPHDALSRVRNQVNSIKRGLMPLHIPAHVRDGGRTRRLSEPVATDDFGNFAFKNLPVLEKANKDVLQKLRAEAAQKPSKVALPSQPSSAISPSPSLEGSPLLPMPLKRTLSANRSHNRPASPSGLAQANASPSRVSQPSSPLLVQFTAGQSHERRKASSTSSTLSHQSSSSLQPGSFFDVPKLPNSYSVPSTTSSPIKPGRLSMGPPAASPDKAPGFPRPHSIPSARARSQTVGSQEGEIPPDKPFSHHHKRRSQVIDISPSSSDNEDPRAKALLRVQRRRQSSRRMSHITMGDGPAFRPLDVLICEDHPVSRMVMERLLEKLRCRTISVVNGPEAARYAMSEVQFDIIMMEYRLPQINGADLARMTRDTKSANTQTPIICVTGYLKELPQTHHFDALIEKPPTLSKLTEALCNLCHWKPPPPGWNGSQQMPPSGLRQESRHAEDSPSSQSSGPFAQNLVYRTSRQHSIGSSFFGDTDSTNTEDNVPVIVSGSKAHEWQEGGGLGITSPSPEDPSSSSISHAQQPFLHPGLPHLIHLNSAPADYDLRTPRKQRSVEGIKAKRENIERYRHECAESGDDEDEELGKSQSRARSPQSRTPRGSKLSTEMMRTNSRGSGTSECGASAVSLHHGANEDGAAVPPSEPPILETGIEGEGNATIVPPEIFPKEAGKQAVVIDMDATPKPPPGVQREGVSQPVSEQKSPSLR